MIQQNKLSNKFIVLFCAMFLIFVIACNTVTQSAAPTPAPTFDLNSVGIIIVKTANAAITQTAAHMPLSPTPSPSPAISPEAFPTTAPTNTPTPYTFGSFKAGDPTATPLGSDITDPNFKAGVEAHAAKNYAQTVTLMSSVIDSNPNLAPPYRYRGISYWYLGRCDEALADFDHALSVNPNYAAAWAGRGLTNDCLGNKTQMLLDYQTALSIDPSLAFVHQNLGVYYHDSEDYEKSLEEYTISASIDPNRAGAWSGKAQALFRLGRYEECIVNASKAIETDPKAWLGYSDRAFCEAFIGNYRAAVKDYETYTENAEANVDTWYNLGLVQQKTDDFQGAVVSYTKALEVDPSYYPAHINRGNVYLILGEYKKALTDFNKALEFGDIPFAYSGRGDAYHALKEYDKAVHNYKKVIELDPSDAHAYCFLSSSYLGLQRYQESIEIAQEANPIDPNCVGWMLYETEARSYYGLENYDQALVYINKALTTSEYPLGHYYRGIIYQDAGENQASIQDLELFLSSVQSPESYQEEIADAKARLAQLK
jgi:tetratricopeptide (TPR) repeat protein